MSLRLRMTFCLLWLFGAASGFGVLLRYQSTEGSSGKVPAGWPQGASATLDDTRDTLIMFVHPQCPCSRASIEELNRLMAKSKGKVAAEVYFFRPAAYPSDWVRTDLWRSAAAIPDVSVHEDIDGAQAKLFGAETSGHVLLFDTNAHLLFSGGITESRGHAGDNAGENAIASLAFGEAVNLKQTPVYGCSLLTHCDTAQKAHLQ